jgi:hypothetical protein
MGMLAMTARPTTLSRQPRTAESSMGRRPVSTTCGTCPRIHGCRPLRRLSLSLSARCAVFDIYLLDVLSVP